MLRAVLINSAVILIATTACAMDISVRQNGFPAVLATGAIEDGDAARLRIALLKATRNDYGLKELYLNSPGGSVDEAFKMAELIDRVGVFSVVGEAATCASACAMILFTSAKYRVVTKDGKLGIHTCYSAASRKRDTECNERIAEFAVDHGTAYGSIMAFANAASSDEMMWFPKQSADCWGLTKYPEGQEPRGSGSCIVEVIQRYCRAKRSTDKCNPK